MVVMRNKYNWDIEDLLGLESYNDNVSSFKQYIIMYTEMTRSTQFYANCCRVKTKSHRILNSVE